MFVNYSLVVISMALFFVLDSSMFNSVSASSSAKEPRFIRVLRRRSLNTRSVGDDEETTQAAPTGTRPTSQSGVPQLGLSPAMMKRVSAGLVSSIAKFSADMQAGVEFPTQPEMTKAVDQALETADDSNFAKVAQAIKNSIDALADRKLAEGETGKSRASTVTKPCTCDLTYPRSSGQIATALLDTIKMFCAQKAKGGRLPTASEVDQVLTPYLQKIDFSNSTANLRKGAEAIKFGLDSMGNSEVRGLPLPTQRVSEVQV